MSKNERIKDRIIYIEDGKYKVKSISFFKPFTKMTDPLKAVGLGLLCLPVGALEVGVGTLGTAIGGVYIAKNTVIAIITCGKEGNIFRSIAGVIMANRHTGLGMVILMSAPFRLLSVITRSGATVVHKLHLPKDNTDIEHSQEMNANQPAGL